MRILFLSRWFPFPANNGSKLRILHLLRGLAARHDVTLLSFCDNDDVQRDEPTLASICDDVHLVAWKPYEPDSLEARAGFFSATPRSFVDTFSREMLTRLQQILDSGSYDLVVGSELAALPYAHSFGGIPALFEDPELGVLYAKYADAESVLHRIRNGLTWYKLRQYVVRRLKYFSAVTVVSQQEADLLARIAPDFSNVTVVPNCIDMNAYRGVREAIEPNRLIFTGPFSYFANHDAMVWFLDEIYPQIQFQMPDVQLSITGDHADLPLPPATNVTLTGFVDDIRPMIAGSVCSLVPLRHGGGTRLKILEAMALGTPVVSTSKGAEGLDVEHGIHLLIADSPQEFAGAVTRILSDPQLRRSLSENALRLVQSNYDWTAVMPRFLELVEQTANLR